EQAEVLEGAPADTPALGGAERGERDGEVGERHASPLPEHDEREVAEPPPEPGPRAGGQPPDEGEERRQDQAARRRRSLRISTAIGITDRTITTMTTMWMYSAMFGIARPSRKPAQVMLVTHPTPPRSEERRVGKECRSRGARYRDKKK